MDHKSKSANTMMSSADFYALLKKKKKPEKIQICEVPRLYYQAGSS